MQFASKTFLCAIAATLALSPVAGIAADSPSAAMMSQVATIPCAQADTAMSQMLQTAMAPDVMKTTGNVDRDYMKTMQIMSGTGLAMSRLEARCGTSAAARKKADGASKSLEPFFNGFAASGQDIRGGGY